MSETSEIDQVHLRAVMLCMSKIDVEDVKDVEDISNTPKGCNAIQDVEDGKRTYRHILAHNFLNT